ncbi:MAG: cytochrome c3 family protein [Spirochaetes bacterium]|nr:cytochrome c3 family protein [Spirochaetota bacterium]
MKRSLLVPVVLMFFGTIFFITNLTPSVKDVTIKKTGNSRTAVLFTHAKHTAMTGEKAKDCTGCHNAVKSKNDAHKYCADCHKSMNSGPRAIQCNECHKPAK